MKGITTPEESKRLIDAGLKRETADFRYLIVDDGCGHTQYIFDTGPCFDDERQIPAWSMAALWDTIAKSNIRFYEFSTTESIERIMGSLVFAVERLSKQGRISNEKA